MGGRDNEEAVKKVMDKTPPKSWGRVKNDRVMYKGHKMYIKDFIRKLAKSLPALELIETGKLVNHEEKLKEAYCTAGIAGLGVYESNVRKAYADDKLKQLSEEIWKVLSTKAKKALSAYYQKDFEAEPMTTVTPLMLIDFERLGRLRGTGATTVAEIRGIVKGLEELYRTEEWLRGQGA